VIGDKQESGRGPGDCGLQISDCGLLAGAGWIGGFIRRRGHGIRIICRGFRMHGSREVGGDKTSCGTALMSNRGYA